MKNVCLDAALSAVQAGLSIIPIAADGSKAPSLKSWKRYQKERADGATVRRWFSHPGLAGMGVVGGAVSGNLEILDFDEPGLPEKFFRRARTEGRGPLIERLVIVRTPSGGVHLYYRLPCPVVGNHKLAVRPITQDEKPARKTLIETRGEGGYVLAPPSPGACHSTGKEYHFEQGSLLDIPNISQEDHEFLMGLARSFDEMPKQEADKSNGTEQSRKAAVQAPSSRPRIAGEINPGEDWARQTTWRDLLEHRDWTLESGEWDGPGVGKLRRPGKKGPGISAEVNWNGLGRLKVYSSNAYPFAADGVYDKLDALVLLEYQGDLKAAVKDLAAKGYGTPRPKKSELAGPDAWDEVPPPIEAYERDIEMTTERRAATKDAASMSDEELSLIVKRVAQNEEGDALLFVDLFKDHLIFDHAEGCWHMWQGHSWQRDCCEEALVAVQSLVQLYDQAAAALDARSRAALQAGNADESKRIEASRKAILARIRELNSVHRRRNVLTLAAAGRERLGCTGEEWDCKPWLLPVANGVVDLKTGELHPGQPSDFIRTAAPTSYNPRASMDRGARFINEIFNGNIELIEYVQRILGSCLVGEVHNHMFAILHGEGRNGKGTLLEWTRHVLGPLAGPIKSEMLLAQDRSRSSGGADPDVVGLRGKRIVWASETGEGRKLDYGKVKWFTGGDTLTGRLLYAKRDSDWTPTHHLFLLTNHKPRAEASEFALWERIVLIPFENRFRAAEELEEEHDRIADTDLARKLLAESEGFLAWTVDGCLKWQKDGLRKPEAVKVATKEYRAGEDVIGEFIAQECTVLPAASVRAGVLYEAYREWCKRTGSQPRRQNEFAQYIRERFAMETKHGRKVYYLGIGLSAPSEREEEPDRTLVH